MHQRPADTSHVPLSDVEIRMLLVRISGWMLPAFLISAAVAYVVQSMPEITNGWIVLSWVVAHLIIVGTCGFMYRRFSHMVALTALGVCAVLTGATYAAVLAYYGFMRVPQLFLSMAGMCVGIIICTLFVQNYEWEWKRSWRWRVLMGLISGVVISSVVIEFFMRMPCGIECLIGPLALLAIVLFDMPHLIHVAGTLEARGRRIDTVALACALRLYLDIGLMGALMVSTSYFPKEKLHE